MAVDDWYARHGYTDSGQSSNSTNSNSGASSGNATPTNSTSVTDSWYARHGYVTNEKTEQKSNPLTGLVTDKTKANGYSGLVGIGNDKNVTTEPETKTTITSKVQTWLNNINTALNGKKTESKTTSDAGKTANALYKAEQQKLEDAKLAAAYDVTDGIESAKKLKEQEEATVNAGSVANSIEKDDKANYYNSISSNEDFVSKAIVGSKNYNANADVATKNEDPGNKIKWAEDHIDQITEARHNATQDETLESYANLVYATDNEKGIYNYLLAAEGTEAADEFLEYIKPTLTARAGKEVAQGISEDTGISRLGREVALATASGLESGFGNIGQNLSGEARDYTTNEMANMYVAEDISNRHENNKNFNLEKLTVDAVNTVANMAPTILAGAITGGVGGAVVGGLSARGATYQQLLNDGYTAEQADTVASIVGVAEATTQYLLGGISAAGGKLTGITAEKLTQKIASPLAKAATTLGVDVIGEDVEEILQNKIQAVVENLYLDAGNDIKFLDKDDLYTAAVTTLSTLVLQTPTLFTKGSNPTLLGKSIDINGMTDSLIDAGLNSTDAGIQEMAENLKNGKAKKTDTLVGELAEALNARGLDLSTLESANSYSKVASTILNNPTLRQQYEVQYGAIEGNSNTEKAKNIANTLHDTQRQNEVTTAQQEAQVETEARENKVEMSADQSYVRGLLMSGGRESAAEIVHNPTYSKLFTELTGVELKGIARDKINTVQRVASNLSAGTADIFFDKVQAQNTNPLVESTPTANTTANTPTNPLTQNSTETPLETQNPLTQQINQPNTENATQRVKPGVSSNTGATTAQNTQNAQISNAENGKTAYDNMATLKPETNERGMSENVRTDESMHPEIRAKYENDPLVYEVAHNKDTLGKALDIIEKGIPQATQYIENKLADAEKGKKMAPEDVPLARMVANELYSKENKTADQVDLDRQRADKILNRIAEELTWAGQFGQAAAILRNADPNIQVRNMQRAVEILNEKYAKQNAKNGKDISIPEDLVEKYRQQDTEKGRNAVIEEMQTAIAEQCGHTIGGMFTALRYLNMLGNFKTQIRNVVGNTGMLVVTSAKNAVGSLMEAVVNPEERTKSLLGGNILLQTNEYKAARQDLKDNPNIMATAMGDAKYSDGSSANSLVNSIESKKKPFSEKGLVGKTVGKTLNAYHTATSKAMEIGDQIFVTENYATALAGYMKANKITPEQWQSMVANNDPLVDKARDYAIKQAQEATFRDTNEVSKAVSNFDKNWHKASKTVTQGIMPFRKTPANVMVRMEEYSPLGVINTVVTAIKAVKGVDGVTGTDVIESLSKTVTGTGLAYIGFALAQAHLAKTKSADDDEEYFDKQNGIQDYSITVGGKNITLDWLTPGAASLFMGVALSELLEDGLSGDAALNIMGQLTDPMLEMSMMSGVNDTLDQLSEADDINSLGQLFFNSCLNYLGQGLSNTLLGHIEQGLDEYRQTYYTDSNSLLPSTFQKWLAKETNKIPVGEDFQTTDYINAWGEKEAGQGMVNALLNPAYVKDVNTEKLTTELYRLNDALEGTDFEGTVYPQTPSRSTTIDGEKLTAEEYTTYATEAGQKKKELVSAFCNSDIYKDLDDATRGEIIKDLYSMATAYAKDVIQQERGSEQKNDYSKLVNETSLDEDKIADYVAFNDAYKYALDSENYTAVDNLTSQFEGLDKPVKETLFEKNSELRTLVNAADYGIDSESYYSYKDALDTVTDKYKGVSKTGSVAKLSALANAGMSDEEITNAVANNVFDLSSTALAIVEVLTQEPYNLTLDDAAKFLYETDYTMNSKYEDNDIVELGKDSVNETTRKFAKDIDNGTIEMNDETIQQLFGMLVAEDANVEGIKGGKANGTLANLEVAQSLSTSDNTVLSENADAIYNALKAKLSNYYNDWGDYSYQSEVNYLPKSKAKGYTYGRKVSDNALIR